MSFKKFRLARGYYSLKGLSAGAIDLLAEQYAKQENEKLINRQKKILPNFLYEDRGIIKVGVHGDTDVTEDWNNYLDKLLNK